jgi:hypothetical protein
MGKAHNLKSADRVDDFLIINQMRRAFIQAQRLVTNPEACQGALTSVFPVRCNLERTLAKICETTSTEKRRPGNPWASAAG